MEASPTAAYPADNILSEDQRYVVKTTNGIIDYDMVGKYKSAHEEALKTQFNPTTEVPSDVNFISSN